MGNALENLHIDGRIDSSCDTTIVSGTSQADSTVAGKDTTIENVTESPYQNGAAPTTAASNQGYHQNNRQHEHAQAQAYDYESPQRHVSYSQGHHVDDFGHHHIGSPQHYSDQSTDNESATSEAYKKLLHRDYLSYDMERSPRKQLPMLSRNCGEIYDSSELHTAILDFNIDFTVHVGKLVIYLKKLKITRSQVEEFVTDKKLKGKVRCLLRNPAKSQKFTSGLFEASVNDRNTLQVEFDESFVYYLFPRNQIDNMALQFKVYCKKMFRDIQIAEGYLHLGEIDLNSEMLPICMPFVDLNKEKQGRHKGGKKPVIVPKSEKLETLISLQYISETSKLVVDLRQSTKLGKLRNLVNREIIVQAELISPTCECVQRKTTFLKMISDNPGCNKPLEFELTQEQLFLYTLMLSVSYSPIRWGQQERIGWIAFGRRSSGQVESQHWEEMLQRSCINEPAIQWHCLCDHQTPKSSSLLKLFK
eukprot:gene15100-16658_t